METNNRRDADERSRKRVSSNPGRGPASKEGFEGMNFEQQRNSYKNSDGAGISGKDPDGKKAPTKH
jgi:hypothetical protein